jgi:thymidylate kinase
MTAHVLVIDGVDGSGKTSIANALALRLNGRYVKAFGGDAGRRIRVLNESGRKAEAEAIARQAARETMSRNSDASLLIFDRHWLSILAFISEEFAPNWQPYPPTVLLRASMDTLQRRLRARGTTPGDLDNIAHYAGRYDVLAAQYDLPRLDTSLIGERDAAQIIIDNGWATRPAR